MTHTRILSLRDCKCSWNTSQTPPFLTSFLNCTTIQQIQSYWISICLLRNSRQHSWKICWMPWRTPKMVCNSCSMIWLIRLKSWLFINTLLLQRQWQHSLGQCNSWNQWTILEILLAALVTNAWDFVKNTKSRPLPVDEAITVRYDCRLGVHFRELYVVAWWH